MEALAVQGVARRDAARPSHLSVPVEIMRNIIENLVPTHNLFNPVYVGSMALSSALEMRTKLYELCLLSRDMKGIATEYLYRVIVIKDSKELARLHGTLRNDSVKRTPVLRYYVQSLAVHQNIIWSPPRQGQYMSLDGFSHTIMSILHKAPRLAKFSLIPFGMEVFQVLNPWP